MKKYMVAVMLLSVGLVHSQVKKYGDAFRQVSSGYTALSGGIVWQSGTSINTDANSAAISLPVAFRFNNKLWNQVYINNNGYIVFNLNGSTAANYAPISRSPSTNGNYEGVVAGFAANLVASTVSGAVPEISYGSSGPNFIIQFKDVAVSGFAANDKINFQLRLSTGTDSVAVAFGACSRTGTATASLVQVGPRGVGSSDAANRLIGSGETWATSIAATSPAQFCSFGTTKAPATGLVYSWQPPVWDNSDAIFFGLPFTEDFEATWADFNSTGDLPNNLFWRSYPSRGETSWRAHSTSNAASGWTDVTWAPFIVASPATGTAARFHSGDAAPGLSGQMDLFLNFSLPGQKVVRLDYINQNKPADGTNTDSLNIQLSTDGGATFVTMGMLGEVNAWATQTINLGTSISPTCILRFKATSDYGGSDIGLDNVTVAIDNTVPVSLLSFTGHKTPAGNELNWVTSTEQNSRGFSIEAGVTANSFTEIGFVNSQATNGNSSARLAYRFTDSRPFVSTTIFYRIKLTDRDSKTTFSPTLTIVTNSKKLELAGIFPTVVHQQAYLSITAAKTGDYQGIVSDINGRVILAATIHLSAGSNMISRDYSDLTSGIYFLRVFEGGVGTKAIKFIKQ
ncbi:MAG: T9SS type A sorting domain-containing protein [Chitinophagaceae bacterium]